MRHTVAPLSRRRFWIDRITQRTVAFGGGTVMVTIALIFLYLLWVVAPIFAGASIEPRQSLPIPPAETVWFDSNETGELLFRIERGGQATFFDTTSGTAVNTTRLPGAVRTVLDLPGSTPRHLVTLADGTGWVLEPRYRVRFRGNQRSLEASLHFPYTRTPLAIGLPEQASRLDGWQDGNSLTLAVLNPGRLSVQLYSGLDSGFAPAQPRTIAISVDPSFDRVFLGPRGGWITLLAQDGRALVVALRAKRRLEVLTETQLLPPNVEMTAATTLLGRYSLLIAGSDRSLLQWFPVQTETGTQLIAPRQFDLGAVGRQIVPEPRRKGFAVIDDSQVLSLFHATAAKQLANRSLRDASPIRAHFSPRADRLLVMTADGGLYSLAVDNQHPELSFQTLWSKVWYEGYDAPRYSWQSSSADNDFEPKFSLVPLAFGTVKAALYALALAIPLAIMGAIYSAYFMAPRLRKVVKPTIETMAALPTVVLGFLAGLWLAPLIERELLTVLLYPFLLSALILLFALGLRILPARWQVRVEGYHALMLLPVLAAAVPIANGCGTWLEQVMFDGQFRLWLAVELGLDYDQRNAFIVGIAMALAVIPTIYAIAEDAIHGVPLFTQQRLTGPRCHPLANALAGCAADGKPRHFLSHHDRNRKGRR